MGKDNRLDKDSVQDLIDSLEMAEEITRKIRQRWAFTTLGRLDAAHSVSDEACDILANLDSRHGR